jgi:hypothetical protein
MSEFTLAKVKAGCFGFAKVEVRVSKQQGPAQVLESLPQNVNEGLREVNRTIEPTWVQAALEGAAEALSVAETSENGTDHFLVEVTKIVGTIADTTADTVKCAAAMATWQAIFPVAEGEVQPQVDRNTQGWFVRYPS